MQSPLEVSGVGFKGRAIRVVASGIHVCRRRSVSDKYDEAMEGKRVEVT